MTNIDDELDKIFLRLWNGDYDKSYDETLAESKQAIKKLFIDVIGEDEHHYDSVLGRKFEATKEMGGRNQLRQQLRKIIGASNE